MHDDLLNLLRRFQENGVQYILVGGHAVRLNGFVRATEDIDVLVPFDPINGARVIKSLEFLPSAREMDPHWFSKEANAEEIENIRVADRILIDILFAAAGETYESLQPHVVELEVDGVRIRTLNIDGLRKTKQTNREKDLIDRHALEALQKAAGSVP
ncbi:MAG: nucleotidyl transferase AbiEii/AbiGii toxin family protein [Gammaproteobacteria bacterium]